MSVAIGEITYTLVMYDKLSDFTSWPKSLHKQYSNVSVIYTSVLQDVFFRVSSFFYHMWITWGSVKTSYMYLYACHYWLGCWKIPLIGFLAKTVCSSLVPRLSAHEDCVWGEPGLFFFMWAWHNWQVWPEFYNKMATFCSFNCTLTV